MTAFMVSGKEYLGNNKTICVMKDGREIPVLNIVCFSSPVDLARLAGNVADALNGVKPRHELEHSGHRSGWFGQVNGVQIRSGVELYVQAGQALSSKTRIVLAVNRDGDGALAESVLQKLRGGETMKLLLESFRFEPGAVPQSAPARAPSR